MTSKDTSCSPVCLQSRLFCQIFRYVLKFCPFDYLNTDSLIHPFKIHVNEVYMPNNTCESIKTVLAYDTYFSEMALQVHTPFGLQRDATLVGELSSAKR